MSLVDASVVVLFLLVLGFQLNFFFQSVFGKAARKQNRFIYFLIYGLLGYPYIAISLHPVIYAALPLVFVFIVAHSYRVAIRLKLIFTLVYAVLVSLASSISIYILYTLDDIDFERLDAVAQLDSATLTKLMFLCFLIMFAVIQLIRLVAKRRSFSLPYRYYAIFLVIPVLSIYHLNILTFNSFFSFLSAIGFLFLNVLIVYIMDTITEKLQFMHENAQLQQQMDYQDANYEKVVHSFKSIKRIIHDTNQQFLYIDECMKRNELEAAREHIKTTLSKIEGAYRRVNTGNLAIDALVTNTLDIGQANGIRIDTKLSLDSQEVRLDRYDLCVVLGNMLDNAIEASKQIKLAEDRYMLIKIHAKPDTLLIHIQNNMEHETARLQSQKPNPEFHGIGLTNIARICDKYGGHMTIETKHKQFHNMVVLPFLTNNP
ncbi:GHKL domain-containing protein [Paenibacillus xanthanilyticus]|uniref:GHKL domain-containing protein n=1 Tax=Paenibacillus xanthanilyticus TaxID=1783531 RepID=A0ABV8JWU3_9BACL